jgi:TRAP transporter 4TM/12TM fusion protein
VSSVTGPDSPGDSEARPERLAAAAGSAAAGPQVASAALDLEQAGRLEEEYDPEMHFRPLAQPAKLVVFLLLVGMGLFHWWTAGFGQPATQVMSATHLAFVLAIGFLVYGAKRSARPAAAPARWWRPGAVPLWDWGLAALGVAAALYYPLTFADLAFRIGNPTVLDLVMGTATIGLVLELTRRAMGLPLALIVAGALLYALQGHRLSGLFAHAGSSWPALVSHLYLTQEGLFGLPIVVMSTVVFHFVMFGVVATRMGLGQLFLDLAAAAAGRYAGGPAKVSVLSSAMFGSISGSSVANTVTTGSLTIPAMKRIGYRPEFAGAVEAAASTGGQIMPPIMGAAAFVMAEFLSVPYLQICIAAAIPAALHFFAVFLMVHLEARRTGLCGLPEAEIPRVGRVLAEGWPTLLPLLVLVTVLFQGYTPTKAAFWGITSALLVGLLNPRKRLSLPMVVEIFALGARYAIAIGAAAAAVGMFVGVITLSGVGFKVSFAVTQQAAQLAEDLEPLVGALSFGTIQAADLTRFFTLLFVAIACVIMGCGIPTTALYIVLAAVAAPALVLSGFPPLAAHLFVLYYGVLADLTPPVCVAAYAAAGIAGADAFKTGLAAFRLGNAKALVPFVFVYAPSMLLVLPGFSWAELFLTLGTAVGGIAFLAAALNGFLFAPLGPLARAAAGLAAVLMISPSPGASLSGLALGLPVVLVSRARRTATATGRVAG